LGIGLWKQARLQDWHLKQVLLGQDMQRKNGKKRMVKGQIHAMAFGIFVNLFEFQFSSSAK
jgi:hypothetical protein